MFFHTRVKELRKYLKHDEGVESKRLPSSRKCVTQAESRSRSNGLEFGSWRLESLAANAKIPCSIPYLCNLSVGLGITLSAYTLYSVDVPKRDVLLRENSAFRLPESVQVMKQTTHSQYDSAYNDQGDSVIKLGFRDWHFFIQPRSMGPVIYYKIRPSSLAGEDGKHCGVAGPETARDGRVLTNAAVYTK
ncbi:hypothetical protein RRG08_021418 [Elysia crispata]|uniref:Uncharacterized protein n=1 Tax=Elysia crispata TaxID=231223 RepID=A0AAE1DT61_9GAST|nr:hypothetical protein RRG08_021418 [Elysia crispata]